MSLKIGVTGGIGSGKSTVCKVFSILGAPVYYADDRARFLMNHNQSLKDVIQKEFGSRAYKQDGTLDRTYLGTKVFTEANQLAILNQLVHPYVAVDFERWVAEQKAAKYIVKEAALLFDSGAYKELDKIIVVIANDLLRIQRVMERDPHRDEDDVRKIMEKQMDQNEMALRADYVVKNDGSELILPQLLEIHQELNPIENDRKNQ